MNASTALARATLQRLIDSGVTEVVLAPGSRSAPLAFAGYDAAALDRVRLHTRIDERSAGFLALGLSREHRRAAVVTTSGTAVANLHPAVLEAAHGAVDMVVVTADRPARLRGTGANQTTDQIDVFGRLVPTLDVGSPAELPTIDDLAGSGPTHLNLRLDEPLLPDEPWTPHPAGTVQGRPRPERVRTALPSGPRTVVVAGDDAGPHARQIATRAGWPLLAEPTSGARTGPALRCYRLLLEGPLAAEVERVVVLGRPTLSRPVTRLLVRPDVDVVSVPSPGVWAERPFPVARTVTDVEVQPDASDWLTRWQDADREVGRRVDALLSAELAMTPHAVAETVWRAVPPNGFLHVGASNPIRDLDLVARPHRVGERRKMTANRGLSGIDGVVSTAIGGALARRPSRALALLGDVSFLHDANGLVLGPEEPRPDLTVVVVNDDGGSIFAGLEQGAPEHADRFERLFGTPHGVDLAALCAATRTPHLRVTSLPQLEQALATANGGIEVVEAAVDRTHRRDLDARLRALVADPDPE